MSFWTSQTLKTRILADKIIEPYDDQRVLHSAYEMTLGSEAFITSDVGNSTHLSEHEKIIIPPGQFGLLVTRETVHIPTDVIAFISIRARIKFQGLVNVSGFHVDPGFRGQLKFAVYNAGSRKIILDQGQPIFMIWFADLDGSDTKPYQARPETPFAITAEDISKIQGDVASPAELKKQLDELKTDVEKKFHSIEQIGLIIRGLLVALLVAATGIWAKTCIDDRSRPPMPPAPTVLPSSTTDTNRTTGRPAPRRQKPRPASPSSDSGNELRQGSSIR